VKSLPCHWHWRTEGLQSRAQPELHPHHRQQLISAGSRRRRGRLSSSDGRTQPETSDLGEVVPVFPWGRRGSSRSAVANGSVTPLPTVSRGP